MTTPATTREKLRILADAEFVTRPIDHNHDARAAIQKCILFHLLAFSDEALSSRMIHERTGISVSTVSQTIKMLVRIGVLRAAYRGPNKTRVFDFDWDRLRALNVSRPLIGMSGRPGAEAKRARAMNLAGVQCSGA